MEMTIDYVSVCIFCIVCVVGMVWHVLAAKRTTRPDNNSGDGGGGIPSGFVFPPFDPPSGHGLSLDDWLTDRLPKDMDEEKVPTHFFELMEN